MGRIKGQVDFDWAGADASIQRAIALEPGDPDIVLAAASSAATLGHFDKLFRWPAELLTWIHSMQRVGRSLERRVSHGAARPSRSGYQEGLELSPMLGLALPC